MTKEEFIEEINIKYNFCQENEEELVDELAIENLEVVFLQMDKLNNLTLEELDDLHEHVTYVHCHLEDLGF